MIYFFNSSKQLDLLLITNWINCASVIFFTVSQNWSIKSSNWCWIVFEDIKSLNVLSKTVHFLKNWGVSFASIILESWYTIIMNHIPDWYLSSRDAFQVVGSIISRAWRNSVAGNLSESRFDTSVPNSVICFHGVR